MPLPRICIKSNLCVCIYSYYMFVCVCDMHLLLFNSLGLVYINVFDMIFPVSFEEELGH